MTKTALKTAAYAAQSAKAPLSALTIDRREPGPTDVLIDIQYCGVCHSDIHQVNDDWGGSIFPMVPGHEIVGKVTQVGNQVKKYKVGDIVGVGCLVDSCRECSSCKEGEEQYCAKAPEKIGYTYNGYERDGKTPTYGGYSSQITVDELYVLKVDANQPLEKVAPLLCAGITTYSPLHYYGLKAGDKLGVVGLGGLGHMAVKIGKAMGAHVTVISHSPNKKDDAKKLGADDFLATKDEFVLQQNTARFDFILDTVSAQHDYNSYLNMVSKNGIMVLVGVPDPSALASWSLISHRRRLAGSLIGGIQETQEMLDFCAKHNITADVEVIAIDQIEKAYERMIKGDVRYRFVIDIASLKK